MGPAPSTATRSSSRGLARSTAWMATPSGSSIAASSGLSAGGSLTICDVGAHSRRGKLLDYVYDNNSATAARDGLEHVLRLALASNADRVDVLAHSMGNWVTVEAFRQMKISGSVPNASKFGLVMLAAPDIEDQLRLQWRNHLGGVAPAHLPRWLLLRVLAYRIQAAAFGDLDRAILRRLHEHTDEAFESRGARPFATRGPTTREGVGLKSGALLVREWNGRLERVMILDDGCARNGCVYRSLSQVARAITGTNWNGHRFFGLKAVRAAPPTEKETSPQDRTHCSILACRQPSPGSPPQCLIVRRLSQPRSPNSASPNELAWRHSCEGGPTVRQIGSRKDPRSDPREFPREAQAVQEVRR